ncbi:MAG: Rieske (2Fe-2S) protein, partial [Ilumatobacteraceae bacterium]
MTEFNPATSRRQLLKLAGAFGAAAVFVGPLAACGGSDDTADSAGTGSSGPGTTPSTSPGSTPAAGGDTTIATTPAPGGKTG